MATTMCPKCKKLHVVPDSAAGRKARCNTCGAVFVIKPQAAPSHATPSGSAVVDHAGMPAASASACTTVPKSAEEILDHYRRGRPAGGTIGDKVRRVLGALGTQVKALRLRHEAAGLRKAMEGQWEALGMLLLQHRPAGIELQNEVSELSQVHNSLAEKQATLDALRQTKGSGPVARDIERELRLLREKQRQIMIGVGRDTEPAKVDAPGANGHYSALSTLRSALATKEAELATIEERVGPVSLPKGKKLLLIGIPAGLLLVAGIVVAIVLAGGSGGPTWGSPYSVSYRIVSDGPIDAGVDATVKGPAAKLGVILTDPNGESDTKIIEKEDMISNCRTVRLRMRDPREGTYVLTVKTIEPEKNVWKDNIPLSLGKLTVKDVKCLLAPERWRGDKRDELGTIQITLQKTGNLPIIFTGTSFTVGGSAVYQTRLQGEGWGCVMVDQEWIANIAGEYCPPTKKQIQNYERGHGTFELPPSQARLEPGERYLVKGKLFYGDHKSLDFEKELVGRAGNDTFQVVVPAMTAEVKQGQVQIVRVSVDRGEGFKQRVKLEVKAPAGFQVDPASTMVKPDDKGDVQLEIKAAKDAPLGEQKIQVRGTPDKGEPTEAEFKVTVSAK